MHLNEKTIQQLVAHAVAAQDEDPLGVVVIILGRDSVSIGGVGEAPSQEEVGLAMAQWGHYERESSSLH